MNIPAVTVMASMTLQSRQISGMAFLVVVGVLLAALLFVLVRGLIQAHRRNTSSLPEINFVDSIPEEVEEEDESWAFEVDEEDDSGPAGDSDAENMLREARSSIASGETVRTGSTRFGFLRRKG